MDTPQKPTEPAQEPQQHTLHIADLRAVLFETIAGVKSGKLNIEKAQTISELSQVIVNTAKVEVDFIRATGAKHHGSGFLERPAEPPKPLPPGITGVQQHRISDVEPGN